jgi:myo-inositol-1(or 4)-monophosphatase
MELTRQQLCKQIAREAGKIILSYSEELEVYSKDEGRGNFATNADLKSEELIISQIKEYFPDDLILSEESYSEIAKPLEATNMWVIDPIDGTNNFKAQRDYSAVSIGFVNKGKVQFGAIYNPYKEQLYSAERDCGAFVNDKPISVSAKEDLTKCEIATDSYYTPEAAMRNLQIGMKIQPFPIMWVRGSAVTAMTEVASGRTDLYFHTKLKPWDNAAAFILLEEAGAIIKDHSGNDVNFMTQELVVGNTTLVKQFIEFQRL